LSNYTKSTNFATKDNLSPGDPLKIVRGTEIDTEFNNISTAISTKTDNSAAAITGGSISGITDLAIADGGTGASTATAALNNLLPSQSGNASKYLQTDGTNATWDAISINTGDITGTLAVANGGTGQTSQTAGFDSLAPTTTKGDVIVHNGTDNIRLAKGTDAYFLKANSATASGLEWVAGTATESVAGVAQIADSTETFAGTDDATIVTPLKLRQWGQGQYKAVQVASTKTVDYTDIGQYIYNTGSSGYTVTTPTSADITYPIGARIDFAQTGTGTITFAAGSGVTISGASGMVLRQYKAATLVRISSTSWHLIGGASA